jgi:putative FmdB family regulatory protein
MPIYEYRCRACRRRFRKLVPLHFGGSLSCLHCQSDQIERLLSRFAAPRTEEAALDAITDEFGAMADSDDPQALRRLAREMGGALGEDLESDLEAMHDEETASASDL